MSDVYRLERTEAYRDETGRPFYDVTKNGVTLLARVYYSAAFALVVSLVADDDRFQEVTDGRIDCDVSGKDVKRSKPESGS